MDVLAHFFRSICLSLYRLNGGNGQILTDTIRWVEETIECIFKLVTKV